METVARAAEPCWFNSIALPVKTPGCLLAQVEPDEAHIAVGKRVNRLFRSGLEAIGLEKQLLP